MGILFTTIAFFVGMILGAYATISYIKYHTKKSNKQYKEIQENYFIYFLSKLLTKEVEYSRINNFIYLNYLNDTNEKLTLTYNIISRIIYITDVANVILASSNHLEAEFVDIIINNINTHNNINDIIVDPISKQIYDVETYKNLPTIKIDMDISDFFEMESQNDLINHSQLNINDILDKISECGIDSLTEEERKFIEDNNNK